MDANEFNALMIKKICLLFFVVLLCNQTTIARNTADTSLPQKDITYLLPDGRVIGTEKFDSLFNAWGADRVLLLHSKEDDAKNIIRLARMSDEMKQELEEKRIRSQGVSAAMIDKPAPEFMLTDLQGKSWSLQQLRGRIVILNFWFTSCTPCIREMPELNKLTATYDSSQVVFLALTYNNVKEVTSFLQKRQFTYTIIPGSQEVDKMYHVSEWPTSIVIDKKGLIKMIIHSDPAIRERLEKIIDSLK